MRSSSRLATSFERGSAISRLESRLPLAPSASRAGSKRASNRSTSVARERRVRGQRLLDVGLAEGRCRSGAGTCSRRAAPRLARASRPAQQHQAVEAVVLEPRRPRRSAKASSKASRTVVDVDRRRPASGAARSRAARAAPSRRRGSRCGSSLSTFRPMFSSIGSASESRIGWSRRISLKRRSGRPVLEPPVEAQRQVAGVAAARRSMLGCRARRRAASTPPGRRPGTRGRRRRSSRLPCSSPRSSISAVAQRSVQLLRGLDQPRARAPRRRSAGIPSGRADGEQEPRQRRFRQLGLELASRCR